MNTNNTATTQTSTQTTDAPKVEQKATLKIRTAVKAGKSICGW